MSQGKHDIENEGAKPRDHGHARHHFWKHAHRDWRVWCAVVLMLACMAIYLMTDDLSLGWGRHAHQASPAFNAP
jgi:hypothetical protein